jgi:hypothetical protein
VVPGQRARRVARVAGGSARGGTLGVERFVDPDAQAPVQRAPLDGDVVPLLQPGDAEATRLAAVRVVGGGRAQEELDGEVAGADVHRRRRLGRDLHAVGEDEGVAEAAAVTEEAKRVGASRPGAERQRRRREPPDPRPDRRHAASIAAALPRPARRAAGDDVRR